MKSLPTNLERVTVPMHEHDGRQAVHTGSVFSPLFTLNKNLLVTQSDPDDPHQYATLTNLSGNDLHPIVVENTLGLPHLNLMAWTVGAITTGAVVAVFGGFPLPNDETAKMLPFDFDAVNFGNPYTAANILGWLWEPLYKPGAASNLITIGTTTEIIADANGAGAPAFRVSSLDNYVYTRGARKLLALTSTAMAGPTAAMLTGRLSG